MPKRKRSRKNERKTGVYRKKRKRSRKIPRGLFAKTTKMAFRYVDTISLDPGTTNAVAYHTFNPCNMFDPDVSGAGHQPYGFDQYMQFYQHYTVIGSKIKCTFMPQVDTAAGQAYVGLTAAAGAPLFLTDINTLTERKASNVNMVSTMQNKPVSVTKGVSHSKFFGQKVLQEDANAGTVTTGPSESFYYHVFAATNHYGITDPAAIRVRVQIDFLAVLHEPKQIAGS